MTNRIPTAAWLVIIAAGIVVSAAFMFGVTTFLFAFSSGQSRMVQVVNYGALAMLVISVVTAIASWILRPGATAAKATAAVVAVGWFVTTIVEFILSFFLGAGTPPGAPPP
ncbi:MAG TPA: hypothetical protein VHM88_21360 [Candidatus Acidoferrales bacterium]|jgi:uncharacterized membrane protein|nr:hypothetical protein [Candidatus Dormibacteraeota bacterium]HEX2714747.1 hypothetical protein [Candidatus Acidoferrales bacterium]